VGPPGSGKTTQGGRLAEAMGIRHFSVGEEIRLLRATGVKLAFDRKTGLLTPEATRELLARPLADQSRSVIDGIPRTPEQVPLLVDLGITSALVIAIDIDFPTAMARMRGRGREGEDPGVIAMRHSDHERRSPGLLAACQEAGWQVRRIDGSPPIGRVADAVLDALNGLEDRGG